MEEEEGDLKNMLRKKIPVIVLAIIQFRIN
jgi:hypothetical protein